MGYGKTSAIATYVYDQQLPVCWYRIEKEDAQLSLFLHHIVESIRIRIPDFGPVLMEKLMQEKPNSQISSDFVREYAALFCNEVAHHTNELLLVLDQYEQVLQANPVDEWLQFVLLHLPANMRIVVISRMEPQWPWFSLAKLRGEAGELNESDLRFSREEIRELLQGDYGVELGEAELSLLDERTSGWIAGVRYVASQMADAEEPALLLREKSVVWRDMQHYWEIELFETLAEDMRSFLIQCSVCEVMEESSLRNIVGLEEQSFERLFGEAKRLRLLFSDAMGVEWRFHPLFHQLLCSKLAQNQALYEQMTLCYARYEADEGRPLAALEQLFRLKAWMQMGEVLSKWGQRLLATGQLDALYRWVTAVPDECRRRFPILWYYQGEIERSRCLYPQALSSYTCYAELCSEQNDMIGYCLGLEGQARVHLDSVQGLKAEELLKQAIDILHGNDPEVAARMYRLLAEVYTNRGNTALASHWYQRSRELEQRTDVEGEARLLFRTGRLDASIQLLEKAWQPDQQESIQQLTRSYRETSLVLAFVYAMIGDQEKGIAVSEKAIELGIAANSPFVEAYGYIRKAHSLLLNKDVPASEIRPLYQRGLAMLEELESNRGKAETLMGLTLLHGREHSLDTALASAQRGLHETSVIQDEWVDGLIRLCSGIAYANCEKYAEAELVFLHCVEHFSQCGDIFSVAIARLWLSYLAYKKEDWNSFVPTVSTALTAIQAGEYQFLLQRPTMFTPTGVQKLLPVLIEAQKRQIQPTYVSQLLTELGLQNVAFHPGYSLRIQTLGAFRIWLDARELGERAWQRGKAKLLFQLLLTKRHHLLAREEIMDVLWSEQDEDTASRDFKVALNALNKALEPNREARATAFFIQRHGSSYGFNLASGYQLDAEEFERLVTSGLAEADPKQAAILLEKGLACYQGEYLPDCRYEDWCIEERERLQVLYLRGAEKLAQSYVALGQHDASIRWCEKILQTDDCWEEAYRLLMICYYAKNNRSVSLKWYEKCVAKLKEQLGVEPLPSTRDTLYLIMDNQ
ncbi:MAG: BTAD domain-containing putative transcriptional regulator [Clostridia bacterium]